MQSNKMKLLVWVFLNIFLIASILFVLDYFKIWSGYDFYYDLIGKDKVITKVEDPLLLDRERLMKREASLNARANILDMRERALEEVQKHHEETMMLVKRGKDQIDEREQSLIMAVKEKENIEKNIKDLSEKITNMPPAKAVEKLETLDPIEIIDIFRQIDKNAKEAGIASISSKYLSDLSPKKSREVMRLKLKSPLNPKDNKPKIKPENNENENPEDEENPKDDNIEKPTS